VFLKRLDEVNFRIKKYYRSMDPISTGTSLFVLKYITQETEITGFSCGIFTHKAAETLSNAFVQYWANFSVQKAKLNNSPFHRTTECIY